MNIRLCPDWRCQRGPNRFPPEVAGMPPTLTRHARDAVGCDLFIDVHGDEALPANFFVDSAGIPGWTPRLQRLHDAFSAAMLRASRDFQTTLGVRAILGF